MKPTRLLVPTLAALVLLAVAGSARAEPPTNAPATRPGERFKQRLERRQAVLEQLIRPELVMKHQQELGLTEEQKKAIRETMSQAMGRFQDLRRQQEAEMEKVSALLGKEVVDSAATLSQLDKVLTIENDLKRLQLQQLIALRNLLTPEQRAKLAELKKQAGPQRGSGAGRGAAAHQPPPATP